MFRVVIVVFNTGKVAAGVVVIWYAARITIHLKIVTVNLEYYIDII